MKKILVLLLVGVAFAGLVAWEFITTQHAVQPQRRGAWGHFTCAANDSLTITFPNLGGATLEGSSDGFTFSCAGACSMRVFIQSPDSNVYVPPSNYQIYDGGESFEFPKLKATSIRVKDTSGSSNRIRVWVWQI